MKTKMNRITDWNGKFRMARADGTGGMREEQIADAVNQFGDQFSFNDYGIGLEFRDKGRLTEFFPKTRELYPDSLLLTDSILVSGDYLISQWTQQYTAPVALLPAGPLKVPVCLHGVSVVQIENWKNYPMVGLL